jgi:hypothetical protein
MSSGVAASCLSLCGCACWVLSDFSRPIMMVNGEAALGEKPAELKLVPPSDLNFKVSDQDTGFTVTISSPKWEIEGCGVGTGNGEMIIHSIGGRKGPGGREFVVSETGSRDLYRIFVEDSRGKRHPIP